MTGAPLEFRNLTHEDHLIFKEAMKELVGVSYEPVAVSTQVVNGTMYQFFCNAKVVAPNATFYPAFVYIVKLTTGETKLERVAKIIEE